MKIYLGDSVYADEGDWAGVVVLTTENGYGPSNRIALEPEVLKALDMYRSILAARTDKGKAKPERETETQQG